MDPSREVPTPSIQSDVTLDAPSTLVDEVSDELRRVEVVEGSGPQITGEIQHHLQCRLRLAALVMFFGFGVFLVRNLIWPGDPPPTIWMYGLHGLLTATLGVCGFALCRQLPCFFDQVADQGACDFRHAGRLLLVPAAQGYDGVREARFSADLRRQLAVVDVHLCFSCTEPMAKGVGCDRPRWQLHPFCSPFG